MKYTLTIISILLITSGIHAQRNNAWVDSVKVDAEIFFKEVSKIELIELKPYCFVRKRKKRPLGFKRIVTICTEETIIETSNNNGKLEYSINKEQIGNSYILNSDKKEFLFNLLYNSPLASYTNACYNPRHGIIFYDSDNSIIGFLEICFECNQIYSFPNTPNLGPADKENFNKLKLLFDKSNF